MLIDQLPLRNAPEETDELPIEAGTTTYKTTIAKLLENCIKTVGGTITGALTSIGANFVGKSGTLEVGNPPSTDSNAVGLLMHDKNGTAVSAVRPRFLANGSIEARLSGSNVSSGTTYSNILGLGVTDGGSRYIYVSAKKPWAEGLGYLPVTFNPTITSTLPSGVSAATLSGVRSGYIVQVQINITASSTPSATWQTLASGLPAAAINAPFTIAYNSSSAGYPLRVQVTTGGNLQVARGVAGQNYNATIMYIASSNITL